MNYQSEIGYYLINQAKFGQNVEKMLNEVCTFTNESIDEITSDLVDGAYLYYYLKFQNLGSFEQIKVSIPSLERQREIVEHCVRIEKSNNDETVRKCIRLSSFAILFTFFSMLIHSVVSLS